MPTSIVRTILLVFMPYLICGQTADKRLTFEVASVKPATAPEGVTIVGDRTTTRKGSGVAIPRNTGGPGTDDPGRIHYPLISLKALLMRAWSSYYEIVGPGWLDTQLVQVDATMAPDTTKEQFQEMLRNLITDRFQLKQHIETKQVAAYTLVIARNGLKIKKSADQSGDAPGPPARVTQRGPDGFPVLPQRSGAWHMSMTIEGNHSRMVFQQQTMQDLAKTLGRMLNSTVTDATGLTARYDFAVNFGGVTGPGGALGSATPASSADATDPLPDIFNAVQAQLGLRLEPKKVAVDVMDIDHMEKTPVGN